jgi:hypothetical protein
MATVENLQLSSNWLAWEEVVRNAPVPPLVNSIWATNLRTGQKVQVARMSRPAPKPPKNFYFLHDFSLQGANIAWSWQESITGCLACHMREGITITALGGSRHTGRLIVENSCDLPLTPRLLPHVLAWLQPSCSAFGSAAARFTEAIVYENLATKNRSLYQLGDNVFTLSTVTNAAAVAWIYSTQTATDNGACLPATVELLTLGNGRRQRIDIFRRNHNDVCTYRQAVMGARCLLWHGEGIEALDLQTGRRYRLTPPVGMREPGLPTKVSAWAPALWPMAMEGRRAIWVQGATDDGLMPQQHYRVLVADIPATAG